MTPLTPEEHKAANELASLIDANPMARSCVGMSGTSYGRWTEGERLLARALLDRNAEIERLTRCCNLGGNPLIIDGIHRTCTADPKDNHLIYGPGFSSEDKTDWSCELHGYRAEIQRLTEENATLTRERDEARADRKQCAQYLTTQEEANATLREQNDSLANELKTAMVGWEAEARFRDKHCQEAVDARAKEFSVRAELETAKQERDAAMAHIAAELPQLQEMVCEKDVELSALRTRLETADTAKKWRIKTPTQMIGPFGDESGCDRFIASRAPIIDTSPWRKQWCYTQSEYFDAAISATQPEEKPKYTATPAQKCGKPGWLADEVL